MKTTVALLFGGKSVEHEISVISALQALQSINTEKYEVVLVYIGKDGRFWHGTYLDEISNFSDISEIIKKSEQVAFFTDGDRTFLIPAQPQKSGIFGGKKGMQPIEINVAFPIVHGTNVEDGVLQGYLKTLNLPFVGCDVLSSAVCMDKYFMKTLLKQAGVPVIDGYRFSSSQPIKDILAVAEAEVGYPMIIKPINLGSSIGIGRARNKSEFEDCAATAFSFADKIIVERAVMNLKEVNCAVLGDSQKAEASECEQPLGNDEILSFKDKYMSNGAKNSGAKTSVSAGMARLSRKIPADIDAQTRHNIRKTAVTAFKFLDCCGVARVDFLMDSKTGAFWLNEINTIPGSLSFYLWDHTGINYTELLDRMINLAFARKRKNDDINYTFDTNILSSGVSFNGAKG